MDGAVAHVSEMGHAVSLPELGGGGSGVGLVWFLSSFLF